jgi:alanine racemase
MNHYVEHVFIRQKRIKTIRELIYDTTLEVDLNNLIENYRYFKSLTPEGTKMMVMVKAFSYGLGTFEIAQELEKEGVDYLGVANILEGVEIRKAGVITPIMVMNPEAKSFDLMIENNLSPVIFSSKNLKLFVQEINRKGLAKAFPIHIKIDTGMHRLGATETQLEEITTQLKQLGDKVVVESVFSHLAATDEPEHDGFTKEQINKFENLSNKFTAQFNYDIDRHILNTNGIVRFNDSCYDMVRLGIGLYGVCADQNAQKHLKTVSTLKTKISHIIEVPEGDSIGYGRKGCADSDKRIATIPMGYADGFNRLLSNGKWEVLVNNHPAPIIGNISMDMSMIDVTDIDCNLGDEVVVFGSENTISEMAERINTIPYELFTIISPRVKRVFNK